MVTKVLKLPKRFYDYLEGPRQGFTEQFQSLYGKIAPMRKSRSISRQKRSSTNLKTSLMRPFCRGSATFWIRGPRMSKVGSRYSIYDIWWPCGTHYVILPLLEKYTLSSANGKWRAVNIEWEIGLFWDETTKISSRFSPIEVVDV